MRSVFLSIVQEEKTTTDCSRIGRGVKPRASSGEDAKRGQEEDGLSDTSGGLLFCGGIHGGEVVVEFLDGVHRWVFDRTLGDLTDGRERNAGIAGDGALRDILGAQMRHHKVVERRVLFHGYIINPYMDRMQYPHMVFFLGNNPPMDIAKTIGANLTAMMAAHPCLDTLKKIAARSGVGFGTVQRAKNGDGNITVEKLTAIALAFGRHPAEMLIPGGVCEGGETGRYPKTIDAAALRMVAEDAAAAVVRIGSPLRDELTAIAERINDGGLHELIGEARQIAKRYPRADTGNAAQ